MMRRARQAGTMLAACVGAAVAPLAAQAQSSGSVAGMVTCPDGDGPSLTGLAGMVRDTLQGVVIPGARVSASWLADGATRTRSTSTDAEGAYVLCGLPSATALTVRAVFPAFATAPLTVSIEPGPPAGWDFLVGIEEGVLVSLLRVPGRILGRVSDRRSRRAVKSVAVVLTDTLTGQVWRQVTDGGGRYQFSEMEPGAYRIDMRHVAYHEITQVIDLPSDRTAQVDVQLTVDAIEMEPLVVTAIREKRLEQQGFYERRELGEAIGGGVFLTRQDIYNAGTTRVTHYLGRIPGLRTECTGSGNNNCVIRMTRGVPSLSSSAEWGCANSNVYVDGVRVIGDGRARESIDNFVTPAEVAGIEVYRGPSEIPAEFGGSVGRCGAIVIWTGSSDLGTSRR